MSRRALSPYNLIGPPPLASLRGGEAGASCTFPRVFRMRCLDPSGVGGCLSPAQTAPYPCHVFIPTVHSYNPQSLEAHLKEDHLLINSGRQNLSLMGTWAPGIMEGRWLIAHASPETPFCLSLLVNCGFLVCILPLCRGPANQEKGGSWVLGSCWSLGRLAACVFGSRGPLGAARPGRKQAGPAMELLGPHRACGSL